MPKRFTATEIWDDIWFQELPPDMKLFWKYICDNCDIAGFWKKNERLAEFQIGMGIKWDQIDEYINNCKKRIEFYDDYWYLTEFIDFQYGKLSENMNFHKKIRDQYLRLTGRVMDTLNVRLPSRLTRQGQGQGQGQGHKEKREIQEREKQVFIPPEHLQEIWPHFMDMRKLAKKAATIHAQELIVSKLEKLYPSDFEKQKESLNQSIENSWAGVFPVKGGKSTMSGLNEFLKGSENNVE